MAKEDSFPPSQNTATYPNPEPDQSLPHPIQLLEDSFLILPFHVRLGLRCGYFFRVSRPKACTHLSAPSCVLYALQISIFFIRTHENFAYGVKIMKLVIMQFCPISYFLGVLMPK
jgi:hypothetical protein